MKTGTKMRNSNFELMRITSMFLIVLYPNLSIFMFFCLIYVILIGLFLVLSFGFFCCFFLPLSIRIIKIIY